MENESSKQGIALSILIPSVPERTAHLSRMVEELNKQVAGKPVEVLVVTDNRKRTTGAKRNLLIELAQGQFTVFVDDDDVLLPNYVDSLLRHIEDNPEADCIVFDVAVYLEGKFSKLCKYGIEFEHGEDRQFYYRKPNHLMCHAKRLSSNHKFLDISHGEDDEWGRRIAKDIQQQIRIPEVLYHYVWVRKPRGWYA